MSYILLPLIIFLALTPFLVQKSGTTNTSESVIMINGKKIYCTQCKKRLACSVSMVNGKMIALCDKCLETK